MTRTCRGLDLDALALVFVLVLERVDALERLGALDRAGHAPTARVAARLRDGVLQVGQPLALLAAVVVRGDRAVQLEDEVRHDLQLRRGRIQVAPPRLCAAEHSAHDAFLLIGLARVDPHDLLEHRRLRHRETLLEQLLVEAPNAHLLGDLLARAAALLLLLLARQRRALRLRELQAGLVVVQREQERVLVSWWQAARAQHRLDDAARCGLQRDLVRYPVRAQSLEKLGHELRLHGVVALPEPERLLDLLKVAGGVGGEHAVALDVASHVRLR